MVPKQPDQEQIFADHKYMWESNPYLMRIIDRITEVFILLIAFPFSDLEEVRRTRVLKAMVAHPSPAADDLPLGFACSSLA